MDRGERKYTSEQQAWCVNYEARAGFDPLMDDFEAGNETFLEAAKKSIAWFEDHMNDALRSISDDVPGSTAALETRLGI